MRVQLLHVPDCPSVAPLLSLLFRVAGERPDIRVTHEAVADAGRAAALGMAGSPTLLIDGHDPFGRPDASPGLYSRLYPD